MIKTEIVSTFHNVWKYVNIPDEEAVTAEKAMKDKNYKSKCDVIKKQVDASFISWAKAS